MSLSSWILQVLLSVPLFRRFVELFLAIWNRDVGWQTYDRKVL